MEHSNHTCEVCGHIFNTDDELNSHLLADHDIEADDSELSDDEETAA